MHMGAGGGLEKICGTYAEKICRVSFGTHPQIFSKNANFFLDIFGTHQIFSKNAKNFLNIFGTHPFLSKSKFHFFS